jgi:hypothetical protein
VYAYDSFASVQGTILALLQVISVDSMGIMAFVTFDGLTYCAWQFRRVREKFVTLEKELFVTLEKELDGKLEKELSSLEKVRGKLEKKRNDIARQKTLLC